MNFDARTKVLIAGGVLGALIGVATALLYLRSADVRPGQEKLPDVSPGNAIQVGLGTLTLMRLIAGMGER